MKKLLILSLLISACDLLAQDKNVNFYDECFRRHVQAYYEKKPAIIYLQKATGVTDYIHENVYDVTIVHLNDKEIRNKLKKGDFVLTYVFPIVIENNKITLEIVEYSITLRQDQINMIKHGASNYELGYVDGLFKITDEYHKGI